MIKKALPHLCIIISVMMLVFLVADFYNGAMNFINNDMFKVLLLAFCILVIATSVFLIAHHRRS